MKKFRNTSSICLFLLFYSLITLKSSSQEVRSTVLRKPGPRCGTVEVIHHMLQNNPTLKEQWRLNGETAFKNFIQNRATSAFGQISPTGNLNTVTIPVVVHIVIDSANQVLIKDRDVEEQIEILNKAFAGLNEDSSTLPPAFKNLMGHSSIQFALATKDPKGNFTSGIERDSTTLTVTSNTFNNVKHRSTGGLDAWDVTRYFNVWVCNLTDGVLGISYMPYMTPVNEQGVCIHYKGWSNNPAYTYFTGTSGERSYTYNQGRTLVHETGHYFYLYHIWGDDNGDCSGEDFITESGWPLPDACPDDTPNQGDATYGLYAGYLRDLCAKTLPGELYENYMDYTDDISMVAFTPNQVCRMESALKTYRSSLLVSDGLTSPAGIMDADLQEVSPGVIKDLSYPVILPNTPLTVTLKNRGANNLTKATFLVQYNGGSTTALPWSGSLAPNMSTQVNLGAIQGAAGPTSVTVIVTQPNDGSDAYAGNDTLTRYFSIAGTLVSAPLTESFDGGTFPPAGWSQANMIPTFTVGQWSAATGIAGKSTHTGTGAIHVSNYKNIYTAQCNDLTLPPLEFGTSDSSQLRFWISHGALGSDTLTGDYYNDGLEVDVSADSGRTYQPAFRKTSIPDLRTSLFYQGSSTPEYVPSGQWRQEIVDLSPYLAISRQLLIRFRNLNGYGNDIYLDDVSISVNQLPLVDAGSSSIIGPARVCDLGTVNTRLAFYNHGKDTLSSTKINYRINNGPVNTLAWTGSLAKGDTASVSIPVMVSAATSTVQVVAYTSEPNGVPDQNHSNDTARLTITVVPNNPLAPSLAEGFGGAVFPPGGWTVLNPDNDMPWKQNTTIGYSFPGSAVYNDFHNNIASAYNDLSTPNLHYSGVDSVFLTFELAAATRTTPNTLSEPIDTLSVLLSRDCGNTYTTIYKKWGSELQTLNDSLNGRGSEFFPQSLNQWRKDSINLGQYLHSSESQFMVTFRLSSNAENNIFLDDVNLYTRILPPSLKQQGYLVLPTVFATQFGVWHYQKPEDLVFIAVYNAAGQLVWERQFLGNAYTYIPVDLSGKASGIYFVRLGYKDSSKNRTERVIKQ